MTDHKKAIERIQAAHEALREAYKLMPNPCLKIAVIDAQESIRKIEYSLLWIENMEGDL